MLKDVGQLDPNEVADVYAELRGNAPARGLRKPYFVEHTGVIGSSAGSNRREEHVAVALVNTKQRWPLGGGYSLELLDYQVPLKSQAGDRGIGKIDLLGIDDAGHVVVAELKVTGHRGGPSDPPPTALFEVLRYAAIIEANLKRISREARTRFGRAMKSNRPVLLIVGEESWWSTWFRALPGFADVFASKVAAISRAIDRPIHLASLSAMEVIYGLDGVPPRFQVSPHMTTPDRVGLGLRGLDIPDGPSKKEHEADMQARWWAYAAGSSKDALEGKRVRGRPPVVRRGERTRNLLLPPNPDLTAQIIGSIPASQRHRWFGSFKSSQALAQSVFGAIAAYGRHDMLSALRAECGRPAFKEDIADARILLEFDVTTLGELRQTQLDVMFEADTYRVAVECKFFEAEFGTCSRVKPTRAPICDGTYSVQQGRRARCALSEIGVAYWRHASEIFDWTTERDIDPCPLLLGYQLARNIMAAVVDPSGAVDLRAGHALVVYDARHPAYGPGGAADRQWRSVAAACRWPGSLRRVSWQEIARHIRQEKDLAWLIEGLDAKHGIRPTNNTVDSEDP